MSGPLTDQDAEEPRAATISAGAIDDRSTVEVTDGRTARVGEHDVRRVLPQRPRRTVGAWCFADHFGPADVTAGGGVDIGPHPHIGLQTVTWLLAGEVIHHDSLGSEQLIRPGQLNLMTAGRGIAHAEETPATYRGPVHGVQLWVALPDASRWSPPEFEHHAGLPVVEVGAARLTVMMGTMAGQTSPARADTPLVGAELALDAGVTTFGLDPSFEHAVIALDGALDIESHPARPGQLAYLGRGRDDLTITAATGARALLLGGVPMTEPILMWWNFVARSRGEVDQARAAWERDDERFGIVASGLDRIAAPRPYWSSPAG
jgi:quercetin 2,3-dioxygenase